MFSVHQAASIFYYTGREATSNQEPVFMAEKSGQKDEKGNYYIASRQDDPLASHAIWTGELARKVGLAPGSTVDLRHLTSLWFGFHPNGKTPLDNRGISFERQMTAQTKVAAAETKLFSAKRVMHGIRTNLAQSGLSTKAVNSHKEVKAQQKAIDKAKKSLEDAQRRCPVRS